MGLYWSGNGAKVPRYNMVKALNEFLDGVNKLNGLSEQQIYDLKFKVIVKRNFAAN